jgi:hypothetical protein
MEQVNNENLHVITIDQKPIDPQKENKCLK